MHVPARTMGLVFVLAALCLLLTTPASATANNPYLIGNSLTWDTKPNEISGAQWHIACNQNLQYIFDNPTNSCLASSTLLDSALVDNTYDYVSVQPFYGTTLAQDAAIIAAWMDLQPGAIFVLHTGWSGHATHAVTYLDTDISVAKPSDAYFDALEAELEILRPGRDVRRTRAAEVLYNISQDIGSSPFSSFSDLYRDDIHMNADGKYLVNNLMRLALDQDYELTPDNEASDVELYLNEQLRAVPEPTSMLLFGAGGVLLLSRRRHGA